MPPTPIPSTPAPVPIPEPITVVLFGTGLAALSAAMAARKRTGK
ncbi:MAG: PEP-CTERM sorting domain-containing protein [Caldilinea sp.]